MGVTQNFRLQTVLQTMTHAFYGFCREGYSDRGGFRPMRTRFKKCRTNRTVGIFCWSHHAVGKAADKFETSEIVNHQLISSMIREQETTNGFQYTPSDLTHYSTF
jgi:hypothetical protein